MTAPSPNHLTTRELPQALSHNTHTHTAVLFLGFPGDSAGKESAYNIGDLGSIPGLVRSPGEGKGYPLQCSGLENSMDSIVHRVAKKSQTAKSQT